MLIPSSLPSLRFLGKFALLLALPLTYAFLKSNSPRLLSSNPVTRMILRSSECLTGLRPLGVSLWRSICSLYPCASPYETYETPEQEDAYWKNAEIAQRELSFSDARSARHSSSTAWNSRNEKQILYYTPRLLPEYRDKQTTSGNERIASIPTKALVKWHWLIFPDRPHPTFLQASRLMKRFSARDLREIYRISRLVHSAQIGPSDHNRRPHDFTKSNRQTRHDRGLDLGKGPVATHTQLWRAWLQNKAPDLIICFEEEG